MESLCQSNLLYDQHSSEEELEVINGPSALAAAAESAASSLDVRGGPASLPIARDSSSLEPDELFGEHSPKRSTSSLLEIRKRSLAHSSDDELRNLLEPIATPVNFRTSPPLEALKPNRSHLHRATTPLILTEASRGIENIKISCDNSSELSSCGGSTNSSNNCSNCSVGDNHRSGNTSNAATAGSSTSSTCSGHQIYQPLPKYQFYHNSSRSSSATIPGSLDMEVRSVSPPAKLFHCAISPRRRPMRTHHAPQRLQRPHRPCLDFDKMQQLEERSVAS